jgi:hypothetical protein
MKRTLVLLSIVCLAIFIPFATAQSNEELIAARKKAVDLVLYRDSLLPPELSCLGIPSETNYLNVYLFPENRADEIYIDDPNGFYYFKIEGDKAIPLWVTGRPVELNERQQVNQENTFINYIQHDYNNEMWALPAECGELPDYVGKLEVFGIFSLSRAYKGVVASEGSIECQIDVEVKQPGVDRQDNYLYGVANCDEKQ